MRRSSFLSLRKATFRLGDQLVFPGTTWSFGKQEHWAVIGANGSGKSLFADALRGQLPLVGGDLNYHFRPPAGLSAESAIGHVSFQARKTDLRDAVTQSRWSSFEEEEALRVEDFLAYEHVMEVNPFEVTPRHRLDRPGFLRRRQQAIRRLEIAPYLDRTLISLSNGERQRVQLARALCLPLRLLILDEPFTGLDVSARRHFCEVLGQLMHGPLRVLIITTRPEDLPRGITHLARVEDCRLVESGPHRPPAARADLRPLAVNGRLKREGASPTQAAGEELVRLNHVTVAYGKVAVLQDVNWIVRARESWAVLGPNGSGKTTLLSLLLGDHPQAYGNHVEVFGRRRGSGESIWELKQHIGWVSPELHLHFTDAWSTEEAVVSGFHGTIGLFEPSTASQRAAARRWLRRFGLETLVRRPLFELSAGQQRMVLLARALVRQPKLLVLDEPCQGLDPEHRELIVRTVDELMRAGLVTVLYVTHRKDEIPPSIRKVLRLSAGRGKVELL
jgi:molybdate transport system ATP-binding protein